MSKWAMLLWSCAAGAQAFAAETQEAMSNGVK